MYWYSPLDDYINFVLSKLLNRYFHSCCRKTPIWHLSSELLQRKELWRWPCVNKICAWICWWSLANLTAALKQKLTFNNNVYRRTCLFLFLFNIFWNQFFIIWCKIYAFKLFCHYLFKITTAFILFLIDYLI